MKKQNTKRSKKIRNLVLVCTLCAIVLTVSTYAWFIGMQTVNVSSFDINIAATEGIYLSMDGKTWVNTLDVKDGPVYANNKNVWADGGLIPVSTVGDMDEATSRMKLFEKASLTTTTGGYRLLASQVKNGFTVDEQGNITSDTPEGNGGYVAFDLFIKNLSGTEYYPDNEPLNEEAIYLTTNSSVTVSSSGVSGTGIENSVRVAFAQVGRIEATAPNSTDDEVAKITGITCTSNSGTTGICRSAQIWEPNDSVHTENAIKWYNKSCLPRTGDGLTSDDYDRQGGTEHLCTPVVATEAKPTYVISRAITIDDKVDVYDGDEYNKYPENTTDYKTYSESTSKENLKLVDFPYFTDTMKDKKGMDRPTFMTLAPNSITKVRVYIYIEGQDIDNYDFASIGRTISINFGFTKERFTTGDIDYVGPADPLLPTPSDTTTAP